MHVTVYEARFDMFDQPRAVEAIISTLQSTCGKTLIRTPHACVDWHGPTPPTEDDLRNWACRTGYFATENDALESLNYRYPHWQTEAAQQLMGRLMDYRRWHGSFGDDRLADELGVSLEQLYALARGRKPVKAPKKLLKQLEACHG